MKKFYSILASAVFALSAAATTQLTESDLQHATNVNVATNVDYSKLASKATQGENQIRISAAEWLKNSVTPLTGIGDLVGGDDDDDPTPTPGEWKSIGTGAWAEGPLDIFTDITSGEQWAVEIEENEGIPGYYRLIPYCEGNPFFDSADDTYLYIHAEDPDKVYTVGEDDAEDFIPLGRFPISQLCPEGGWDDYNVYGTLADNVISFPANSHALYYNNGFYQSNTDGKFKIYLPGADVKDYSFSTLAYACNDDETILFMVNKAGADIATIKLMILAGSYPANANNLNYVAQDAPNTIEAGKVYSFTNENAGVYTIFIVALDADGNLQDGAAEWVHILKDDADNWKVLGTGTFEDPLISSAQYTSSNMVFENVTIEVNKENPDYFRIVEPYSQLEDYAVSHNSHSHYIYIDATDPDAVKVELSPVGLSISYGDMSVWSPLDRYTDTADELKEYGYGVASYDKDSHTINFPENSLYFAENQYNRNQLFLNDNAGSLTLPDPAGVENIASDNVNAPVEFFNLQGVRVDNPSTGIFIRRQGSNVNKIVVK